jgi:hypothetical protein
MDVVRAGIDDVQIIAAAIDAAMQYCAIIDVTIATLQ